MRPVWGNRCSACGVAISDASAREALSLRRAGGPVSNFTDTQGVGEASNLTRLARTDDRTPTTGRGSSWKSAAQYAAKVHAPGLAGLSTLQLSSSDDMPLKAGARNVVLRSSTRLVSCDSLTRHTTFVLVQTVFAVVWGGVQETR